MAGNGGRVNLASSQDAVDGGASSNSSDRNVSGSNSVCGDALRSVSSVIPSPRPRPRPPSSSSAAARQASSEEEDDWD